MSSPHSYENSCSKRARTNYKKVVEFTTEIDDQPNLKIPQHPSLDVGSFGSVIPFRGDLPLAPTLKDFLAPGGHAIYAPRPSWYEFSEGTTCERKRGSKDVNKGLLGGSLDRTFIPISEARARDEILKHEPSSQKALFGKENDRALHVAIREHATEAAIVLLEYGASIETLNGKRCTPLVLAAQKGNFVMVQELMRRGADSAATTITGVSSLLQAAHFGHTHILRYLLQVGSPHLLECANYNQTTPLMRASQEGHLECVRLLLEAGAQVNRRNRTFLTSLMLACQRGHSKVAQFLIDYGADIEAMTNQNSTALMLACKRGHKDVVRILVKAGCELSVRDCKGRTVYDLVLHRDQKDLASILDPTVQIDMMQRQGRCLRNFDIIRVWHLLQQDRAKVRVADSSCLGIGDVNKFLKGPFLPHPFCYRSTQALLRMMTLPEPLVRMIAEMLPLPHLWEIRIRMLSKRTSVSPDSAFRSALDLIDEILDEGGFLEACDDAGVPPPETLEFSSWRDWKAWGRRKCAVEAIDAFPSRQRLYLTVAVCPSPRNMDRPTPVEWRRNAGFLQLLHSKRLPLLGNILAAPPYKMPTTLIDKLVHVSDAASLVRRMSSGVHFDMHVAMDLLMLVSQLCSWYWRERDDIIEPRANVDLPNMHF